MVLITSQIVHVVANLQNYFLKIRSRISLDIKFFALRFHLPVRDSHHLTLVDFNANFDDIYISNNI